jgi:hypothetical protein
MIAIFFYIFLWMMVTKNTGRYHQVWNYLFLPGCCSTIYLSTSLRTANQFVLSILLSALSYYCGHWYHTMVPLPFWQ